MNQSEIINDFLNSDKTISRKSIMKLLKEKHIELLDLLLLCGEICNKDLSQNRRKRASEIFNTMTEINGIKQRICENLIHYLLPFLIGIAGYFLLRMM